MNTKRLRIDKLLSNMGLGSRKEIKQFIKNGFVTIDGNVASDPGNLIDPNNQTIYFNGKHIVYRKYIYLMLNKPSGFITATEDRRQSTVCDLVDNEYGFYNPFPVGRLDKDTEGFILLTNDGNLAHLITTPKKHIPKKYYVEVVGKLEQTDVETISKGIDLNDFTTLPGKLEIITAETTSTAYITIYEGKFHQIKRMMEALGKQVTYLKRISMGPLQLDPTLNLGDYRELTEPELELLKQAINF